MCTARQAAYTPVSLSLSSDSGVARLKAELCGVCQNDEEEEECLECTAGTFLQCSSVWSVSERQKDRPQPTSIYLQLCLCV